jgi:hypothetical protein
MQDNTRQRFFCVDCGYDTLHNEYYMVKHSLWCEFGAHRDMLCIGCLENRIGRLLTYEDFLNCPLNADMGIKSARLLDRLAGFKYNRRS